MSGPSNHREPGSSVAEFLQAFKDKRRSRLIVEINLDPVPGWGNAPEDHRELVQRLLDEAVGHYKPTVVLASDVELPSDETSQDTKSIEIPRPQIHTGPKHMTVDEATVSYLSEAAHRVRTQRYWGSGVTALVADLIDSAVAALEADQ